VLGRKIKAAADAYILCEPEHAYDAHLGIKKARLSMESTVYFNERL